MKDYIAVKEVCEILGTTRQNVFYLKKQGIIKDFIEVHARCTLYSRTAILTLKTSGYGKH